MRELKYQVVTLAAYRTSYNNTHSPLQNITKF